MKKHTKTPTFIRKAVLLSVIIFTTLYSCKKDGELYPKFNEENLAVSFTDTFTIETQIVRDDSILSTNVSYNPFGIYNDSIFGLAAASIYSQLTLSGANVNFGNNPIIDSVVLTLKYQGDTAFYGNLFTPFSMEVYELDAALDQTSYYSNNTVAYSNLLGNKTFTAYITDSVQVIDNGDTIWYDPHLRVPLSNTFGQQLLDAGANTELITDNDELLGLFNGFYITSSTNVNNSTLAKGEGGIVYFDINSSLSTLTLYYHNDTDTASYSFIMNSESKMFNYFEHNYTGTDIENHLLGTNYDSTVTYIQAMGGLKTMITIPHIKELAKIENVVINKAELVLSVPEYSIMANHKTVSNAILTGINDEGSAIFLADYFEGLTFFGGAYNSDDKTYTFNISKHLQQLLNNVEEEDYGLYFMATKTAITANRTVIASPKHPSLKMKLNITYSKP